ncbi:MAG: nitrate reductase molybdenum cofactor assembly chaperone [Calditrichaceae bacterium]
MNKMFSNFAEVFSYPVVDYRKHIRNLGEQIEKAQADRRKYDEFIKYVEETDLSDIEELFTRTFDMNPSTCLELGWHLYGEDYQRGEFLVKMRQSLEEFKISESIELPDHLSHCLKLMAVLDNDEVQIFSENYILPAIGKIIKNFPADNPYKPVIEILNDLLEEKYTLTGKQSGDFVSAHV